MNNRIFLMYDHTKLRTLQAVWDSFTTMRTMKRTISKSPDYMMSYSKNITMLNPERPLTPIVQLLPRGKPTIHIDTAYDLREAHERHTSC